MDANTALTCFIAVTLVTLTPGMDTFLVIRNAARGGLKDGLASAFGICCGLFVHAAVSALGVSMILLHTAWAFSLFKLVGALYLMWLGLASCRKAASGASGLWADLPPNQSEVFHPRRSLREGFLSNVLNPKAVVFYLAFLPQFIDPTRAAVPQSLLVAAMHFTVAMIYLAILSATVEKARRFLRKRRVAACFDFLTGAIFFGLGARLLWEKQP
ncbi:MAG: LysE family translocator [Desulfobulbaceae bacterium]|nr:LysE family translocator [Desulfobulbaceae bacterium]